MPFLNQEKYLQLIDQNSNFLTESQLYELQKLQLSVVAWNQIAAVIEACDYSNIHKAEDAQLFPVFWIKLAILRWGGNFWDAPENITIALCTVHIVPSSGEPFAKP